MPKIHPNTPMSALNSHAIKAINNPKTVIPNNMLPLDLSIASTIPQMIVKYKYG